MNNGPLTYLYCSGLKSLYGPAGTVLQFFVYRLSQSGLADVLVAPLPCRAAVSAVECRLQACVISLHSTARPACCSLVTLKYCPLQDPPSHAVICSENCSNPDIKTDSPPLSLSLQRPDELSQVLHCLPGSTNNTLFVSL